MSNINNRKVVLIYKRTHSDDPDTDGIFGINDCMGRVRSRHYDAVIGIGGKKPWPGEEGIALKINWIGVTPTKRISNGRGCYVTFEKFRLYNEKGMLVKEIAPNLYKHMYEDAKGKRRVVMSGSLEDDAFEEVLRILSLVEEQPSSNELSAKNRFRRQCKSKPIPKCTRIQKNIRKIYKSEKNKCSSPENRKVCL